MGENMESLQKSLNTIQAGNAAIAADLETISQRQKQVVDGIKRLAAKGSAAKNELDDLAKQAEEVAKSVVETTQKAQQAAHPPTPGHDLPSGAHPDQGLPSGGAHPDAGLPGQGHISGQPVPGGGHPSGQPLPGGERPNQGLPGTPEPKKR